MKKIAVLPTLLTLGNGICGLAAIVFASNIVPENPSPHDNANFAFAGWLIVLAMFFDMLDGYVARLTKTASDFGGELDSLCDVVSFGVAPAFLLLKLGPAWDPIGYHALAGIAAFYFSMTAVRLARFNVENDPDPAAHKRFKGLPSPGAAGCIAALAILRGGFPAPLVARLSSVDLASMREVVIQSIAFAAPIVAFVVAVLMVSTVPYPHATGKILTGRKHFGHLIQVILGGLILVMSGSLAPILVFWIYAFIFPLRYLVMSNLPEQDADAPPPSADEQQAPNQT